MEAVQISQAATPAKTCCMLLERLPREIRDQIWKEVFIHQQLIIDTVKPLNKHYLPGLLQTCRRARAEATKLFWKHTHFRLIVNNSRMLGPITWLKKVSSKHRQQIKTLTLHFERARYHAGSSSARHPPSFHLPPQMPQSKHHSTTRNIETLDLLDSLASLRHFDRSSVRFDISDFQPTTIQPSAYGVFECDGWMHFFLEQMREMRGVFAEGEVERGCRWCGFGWEADGEDGGGEEGGR